MGICLIIILKILNLNLMEINHKKLFLYVSLPKSHSIWVVVPMFFTRLIQYEILASEKLVIAFTSQNTTTR